MHLYLDTGNVDEIRRWMRTGIDGVTTNPSLIAKEGRDFATVIREIVALFIDAGSEDFTVSAEVTALDADAMVAQARNLAAIDPHVVVKIPITVEGVAAIRRLAHERIRTNATLCFSMEQAILVAKAGAWCVSPFIGRLEDKGEDGIALVHRIRTIYDGHSFGTKVLAASIRNAAHVAAAAEAGADIVTVPPKVFAELFTHPLTDAGLKRFMEDWERHEKRRLS